MLLNLPIVDDAQSSMTLDLLPLGALVIDSTLCIQQWNRKLVEWTGIPASIAIGQNLTELFPNVSDPRYLNRLLDVFNAGLPATYSAALHKHFLKVRARHGLDCEWMIQQTDVRRISPESKLAIITIQDVSFQYVQLERLKSERQTLLRTRDALAKSNSALCARNAELDDFAKVASHDLQEPLRSIRHLVSFLREDCGEAIGETGQGYLDSMDEASQRMSSLIRDILLLSRMGSDGIDRQTLNLNDILGGVRCMLDEAIKDVGATIVIPELPEVEGDARMVAQLFQNLIGNALKFVDKDAAETPQVEITADHDGQRWVLGVKDNGIGIEPKFAKRIFEPFQRLHRRTAYKGTGIGLAICRKSVAHHGGEIWVESALNEGAHFRFYLSAGQ